MSTKKNFYQELYNTDKGHLIMIKMGLYDKDRTNIYANNKTTQKSMEGKKLLQLKREIDNSKIIIGL